ncbi:MAG: hypothetical protein HY219_02130 [Candidatus Staskawiczbacteria bacterium]|nr:hypothetical protein [Candidatus Staskawiczbacteria bacterium]
MSEKKYGRVTVEMLKKSNERHEKILEAVLEKERIYKELRGKLPSKNIHSFPDIFKADEEMKRQEETKAIKFSNKMASLNLPFQSEDEHISASGIMRFVGSLFKGKILVFHLRDDCPYFTLSRGLEKFLMFFRYQENRFLVVKDRPLVKSFFYGEFKKIHETVTRNSDYAATVIDGVIEDVFNPLWCINLIKKKRS